MQSKLRFRFLKFSSLVAPLFLLACGSGNDQIPVSSQTENTAPNFLSDSAALDPFEIYPGIQALDESDATGLKLAYTDESRQDPALLSYVDVNWVEMQSCLEVNAPAPLVILQEESVEPLSSTDDVIFDFQGRLAASANDNEGGTAIQVLFEDLDEEANSRGFNLRSIMGRYLWRVNELPERDYQYACATADASE